MDIKKPFLAALIVLLFIACTTQPPPIDKKPYLKTAAMASAPTMLFEGHDNGIGASDGETVYMITGDGHFPYGGPKHQTAVFKLPPGRDPLKSSDWEFINGLNGKCYGAICIKKTLYLLISDYGSLWEGVINCRILNFSTGDRSDTLQSKLLPTGGNFFFVQHAPGNNDSDLVYIGAIQFPDSDFWRGQVPIPIWSGRIDDINSFSKITDDCGLRVSGSDYAIMASIIRVPEIGKYVGFLGDIRQGIVHEFRANSFMGPWTAESKTSYNPPMVRRIWRPGIVSGPFTSTLFEYGGQWFQVVTGVGDVKNDCVYMERRVWVTVAEEINFSIVPVISPLLLN